MATKRLIDANALIRRVVAERDFVEIKTRCDLGYHNGLNMAVSMAINAPTVDAVEVVRCKDCKWYAPNNGGSWLGCAFDTRHPDDVPKAEDFCSYGERKDGDGDD